MAKHGKKFYRRCRAVRTGRTRSKEAIPLVKKRR